MEITAIFGNILYVKLTVPQPTKNHFKAKFPCG